MKMFTSVSGKMNTPPKRYGSVHNMSVVVILTIAKPRPRVGADVCMLRLYADMALDVLRRATPERTLIINADGPSYAKMWTRDGQPALAVTMIDGPTWIQIIDAATPVAVAEAQIDDSIEVFDSLSEDGIIYP